MRLNNILTFLALSVMLAGIAVGAYLSRGGLNFEPRAKENNCTGLYHLCSYEDSMGNDPCCVSPIKPSPTTRPTTRPRPTTTIRPQPTTLTTPTVTGPVSTNTPTRMATLSPTPYPIPTQEFSSALMDAAYDLLFFAPTNERISGLYPCVEVCTEPVNCRPIPGRRCLFTQVHDTVFTLPNGQLCGQGGTGAVCTDFVRLTYRQAGKSLSDLANSRWVPHMLRGFKTLPGLAFYENFSKTSPQPGDVLFFGNPAKGTATHVAIVAEIKARAIKFYQYNARQCGWVGKIISASGEYHLDRLKSAVDPNGINHQVLGWGRMIY